MNRLTLVLLFMVFTSHIFAQKTSDFVPRFQKSSTPPNKIPPNQTYTFGYLEVPENRSDPNSQTIKLPVYIFKSRNPNPPKDPIIYTVGGPGSTTMSSAPYMNYYQYLDDRDFILFEQRGNYYAQPHLDCPEWAQAVHLSNLPSWDSQKSDSLFTAAAQQCRDRLTSLEIDLNGYHTHEIAADFEDLRKALGIEQYNLLTISYSTKIAQVIMREYPQTIRSVVMDSPLPLEVSYDEESAGNLMEAVEQLLSDCEKDTACNNAFPHLKQRFYDFLIDKTENPMAVTVNHPTNGKEETFYLQGQDLITVFTSASTSSAPAVPFEINRILNNDWEGVKKQLEGLFGEPGIGDGIGMRLSVWCAEEFPFVSQEVVRQETNAYAPIKGLSPAVFDSSICAIWRVKPMPEVENQAVESDIPVLLLSGEYDSETPPKWARLLQQHLPNSFHLVFKGWKHTVTTNWGNPCAMQVANAFFNDPGKKPDVECFEEIISTRFKTQ